MSASQAAETGLGITAYLTGSATLLASAAGLDALSWLERVGFPAFLVLALLWLSVRAGRWLGEHVLQPIAGRVVHLVDELRAALKSQTAAIEQIAKSETRTLEVVERLEANAAEDRATTREALNGLRAAIDSMRGASASLDAAVRGETPAAGTPTQPKR